jgi:hypothetical protein
LNLSFDFYRSKTTPKHPYLLGWQPRKTAKDWDEELEETWKAVLAETSGGQI